MLGEVAIDPNLMGVLEVQQMRVHGKAVHEATRKKTKKTCPECGKDVHDPDCAYNIKNN